MLRQFKWVLCCFIIPILFAQNLPSIPQNYQEAHNLLIRAYQLELAQKYDEALQYYSSSSQFFEKGANYTAQCITIYWNMSGILISQGQYQASLEPLQKGLNLAYKLNNEKAKLEFYNKLAIAYAELAKLSLAQAQFADDFKFDLGARKIIFNITGDNVISLNNTSIVIASDQISGEIFDLKQLGIILPGKYNFTIEAPGFQTITFQDEILPSKVPYNLAKNLVAGSREVKFKITGEYPAGEEIPSIESITLNGQPIEEGSTFASGQYLLEINTPNYFPLQDTITITVGSEPLVIEKVLITKPVVFQEKITFDLEPPTYLGNHRITFAPVENPTQEKTIRPGDTVKPGHYIFRIRKEAYETVEQNKRVWPSEAPFVLKAELQPKEREIQVVVEHDVPPPIFLPGWSLKMKAERATSVTSQNKVRPGKYTIEIAQPGYTCMTFVNKMPVKNSIVDIPPAENPFVIQAKFTAEPRLLAREVIDERTGSKVPVAEICIDNQVIPRDKKFAANEVLNVVYKFQYFKDATKKVYILPGEGPVSERLTLQPLKQYTLKVKRREDTLDNIRYSCAFAVSCDRQKFEEVQEFQVESDNVGTTFNIWADPAGKKIRMYHGYLYTERATDQLYGVLPPPDNIDVVRLNQHLDRKIREKNLTSAISILENMTKNRIHIKRLKGCADELDLLIQHIQKWEVRDDQQAQRIIDLLVALDELK